LTYGVSYGGGVRVSPPPPVGTMRPGGGRGRRTPSAGRCPRRRRWSPTRRTSGPAC
jgi:hypothetical protein